MGAGVDDAIPAHIHRLAQNVGRHIGHQGNAAGLRDVVPLGTEDGVIGAVVEVPGVRAELQLLLGGDTGVIAVAGIRGHIDGTVFCRFLAGDFGEVAGDGVVRLAVFPHQIQRNHGKLGRRAALEKQNFVGVRYLQKPLQICLRLVKNLLIDGGAVAHLHDGHSAAVIIQQLARGDFKYLGWQRGRTCREVIGPLS